MSLTYNELRTIVDSPTMGKTIAPNTIAVSSGKNAIRIILHGNPIFDILDGAYYHGDSMRILPSAFIWFTNTTQNRISIVCLSYEFTVKRQNKPEKHYIITKRNKYGIKIIEHKIYEDSYPFPLLYNPMNVSFGSDYRGYTLYIDGDYSYYEQHG